MRATLALVITAALALAPVVGAAEGGNLSDMFGKANAAFWKGDFAKAAEGYAKLEELGVRSRELDYNRATAEARLGHLGRAVQYYERVLRREPGDEDAVHNLQVIREYLARRASEAGRNADLVPATTAWRALLDRFTPRSAAFAFAIFHLGLFAALALRRFTRKDGALLSLGVAVGVLALLWAFASAIAFGKWRQTTEEHEAIVVTSGAAKIAEGPGSAVNRFSVDEGSRVWVLERRDGFTKIRDDEGRDGWAKTEELGDI